MAGFLDELLRPVALVDLVFEAVFLPLARGDFFLVVRFFFAMEVPENGSGSHRPNVNRKRERVPVAVSDTGPFHDCPLDVR